MVSCEKGTFVCGIKTKYNFDGKGPDVGGIDLGIDIDYGNDDCNLKVNDASFKCCPKKGKYITLCICHKKLNRKNQL